MPDRANEKKRRQFQSMWSFDAHRIAWAGFGTSIKCEAVADDFHEVGGNGAVVVAGPANALRVR
jgi:hypothetical protein